MMDCISKAWLQGQLTALRALAKDVTATVSLHCPETQQELKQIEFICNRVHGMVEAASRD
jgi:hypothetical protein